MAEVLFISEGVWVAALILAELRHVTDLVTPLQPASFSTRLVTSQSSWIE